MSLERSGRSDWSSDEVPAMAAPTAITCELAPSAPFCRRSRPGAANDGADTHAGNTAGLSIKGSIPYGYAGDDPIDGIDPTGLGGPLSGLVSAVKHPVRTGEQLAVGAYHAEVGLGGCYTGLTSCDYAENFGAGALNQALKLEDLAVSIQSYGMFSPTWGVGAPHPCEPGYEAGGFTFNAALMFVPGAGEAGAVVEATEGIYVIRGAAETYVGQSGDISSRLAAHVASGRFSQAEVDQAERIGVAGGKTAREIAEQRKIDELGGIDNLGNLRNPIGARRLHLMGPVYVR